MPADPVTAAARTWLWQRKPLSTDLEKVLIPLHEPLPVDLQISLQRRYHAGDRVHFTYDSGPHDASERTGTVVQDQGQWLAIDGDPAGGYTIHKVHVHPEHPAATETSPGIDAAKLDLPHHRPGVYYDRHTATARWSVGAPHTSGWQRQARLRIAFQPDTGFVATLCSVEELFRDGVRHERLLPPDSLVVHHHRTTRLSHRAVEECLRTAIDIVVHAAQRLEPVVCTHFVSEHTAATTA
ncbi:hypothetical protein L3Q67_01700 [Saccharothrix sp. AJ9571]|nr:hypothetical protein L3Q67_01700 [Saccharothrix sp. AJ9571]